MSRVCINSCGLKVDSSGKLGVNTSGTWPYSPAVSAAGTKTYCDPTSGALYGIPEKFDIRQFVKASVGSGSFAMNAIPVIGGGTVPVDTNEHHVATASITIVNPSAVLPMSFHVETGVDHCNVTKSSSSGGFNIFLDGQLTITGDATLTATQMGHQIWAATGVVIQFDTMNSVDRYAGAIPAGGTATFQVDGYVRLSSYDGSSTVSNLRYVLDFYGHSQPVS